MKLLYTISLVLSMILFSTCAINPVTGKKQVSFMTEKQEIELGKQNDPAVVAQFGLYENPKIQSFLDKKGMAMVSISHRSKLDYEFKVLDSPVINAFALPGGYIYFTRGILAHFNNEAQFAGVLGHEIGHVSGRHGAEQYTKQTIGQVLFVGGLIFSPEFRYFANEASQGLSLLFLRFSRGHERESDELGVEYSSGVGYNAYEMAKFFKTLDRLGANSSTGRIPEFLSTHPDPGKRFEKVNELTKKWQDQNGSAHLVVRRDEYLDMIDGMIYGEDPKQGYTENNVFYHPELKFKYNYPKNWTLVNSPIQVQMAPADGKALMVFTLSPQKTLITAAEEVIKAQSLQKQRDLEFEVNGLPAYGMVCDQVTEDPNTGEEKVVAVQSVFIKYDNLIYIFHGLCAKADFSNYEGFFDEATNSFMKLTDPKRLNVKPERIKIVKAKKAGTFADVLAAHSSPASRNTELAILNGYELTDQIRKGAKFKLISK